MCDGSISIVYFLHMKQYRAIEHVGSTVIQEAQADGSAAIFNIWLPSFPQESPHSNQPEGEGEKSKDAVRGG